jgi:hypothetical protein
MSTDAHCNEWSNRRGGNVTVTRTSVGLGGWFVSLPLEVTRCVEVNTEGTNFSPRSRYSKRSPLTV